MILGLIDENFVGFLLAVFIYRSTGLKSLGTGKRGGEKKILVF